MMEAAEFDHIVLERVKIGLNRLMAGEAIEKMTLERNTDYVVGDILFQLETFLLGEKVQEKTATASVSCPKTWWQHFKQAYGEKTKLGRWYLEHRPVQMLTVNQSVTLQQVQCYPLIEHVLRPHEKSMRVTVLQAMPQRYWES